MQLGMIGLGRMGTNLVRRLSHDGHQCVVYDRTPEVSRRLAGRNITAADNFANLARQLDRPRAIWVMLPASVTGEKITELSEHLESGDIIIDGGNSYYRDDLARAEVLKQKGLHYIDCGTSGGVFGLERGFCLMIGGEEEVVMHLDPIFRSIAPGPEAAPRTLGRSGNPTPEECGYLHCGPTGAGHFVKMVHNGIEYGLMAAYAEGLNVLRNADAGRRAHEEDAETAPMRNPEFYQYDLDLPAIAEVWRRGSVVASWLLDLTAAALVNDADLDEYSGRVSDSGEGRWTALAAIDEGVPTPVISTALFERFASRGDDDYADRLLSAMRKQFGGHNEKASHHE
ncbi:MAG: decarboxylating 6-phosphogluconate dehydrogenase [Gammaproteobacteria bacterium]|jgi:6-phosphogluconate dehydrogenase